MLRLNGNLLKFKNLQYNALREKTIDKSRVPVLNECDLVEKFIKGTGPGGQKVNKTNSCVYLLHKPTGFSVKVNDLRDQHLNRKLARERLITKIDNSVNGEFSIENQLKALQKEKVLKRNYKKKRLSDLKKQWKESFSESTE